MANSLDPLAAELKRVRADAGLTLAEWSKHVGIPEKTLHGYETGRITPPADRLLLIVHATQSLSEPFQAARVARDLVRGMRRRKGPQRARRARAA